MVSTKQTISDGVRRLLAGAHHDPFDVLGCHRRGRFWHIKALLPGVTAVELVQAGARLPMKRLPDTDLFSVSISAGSQPLYRLRSCDSAGHWHEFDDPYRFKPFIGDLDLHMFAEGRHQHLYRILGAHCCQHEGVAGVRFATWAPNADRVSVVGDFNA